MMLTIEELTLAMLEMMLEDSIVIELAYYMQKLRQINLNLFF